MSSSTFEVKESESDNEKALDFGIDTCEENGVVPSQVDGDVPKDHTYNKEPDILEDEELKENEDSNIQLDESMENNDASAEKSRPSKTNKADKAGKKSPARGKAKKTPAKKETATLKKGRSKKDDVIADVEAVTIDLTKESEDETAAEDPNAATAEEEQPTPVKRGRKRKAEEKENEPSQDSVDEPDTEEPPEKKSTSAKGAKSAPEKTKRSLPMDGIIDYHNLPKGWLRKTVIRKTGRSAGQIDVYIYSPDGFKFRSKPEIVNFLNRTNSNLKIEDFDFSRKHALENETVKAALTAKSPPKKKSAPVKSKPAATKKKEPASPKKSPKLLVKIVSERKKKLGKKIGKKSAGTKKTPEKGKKTTAKVVGKGSKKKKA